MTYLVRILVCCVVLAVFITEGAVEERVRAYKINRNEVTRDEFEALKAGLDIDDRFFEEGVMMSGTETHYHATEKATGKKYIYIVRAWTSDVEYEFRPEYQYQDYGKQFPAGDYVFDGGLTLSIERGGHKRPYTGGPYRSWVVAAVELNGKRDKLPLYCDQQSDKAPVTYTETEWEGFIIKRLAENEFVVIPQKVSR